MGLFNDYESSGVGISKNAPRKKGIFLFFEIFLRKFWAMVGVNILYSIFALLPLFISFAAVSFLQNTTLKLVIIGAMFLFFVCTIGSATAGMTKVMRLFVLEKHSFIVRDFFRGFKSNFKQGIVIGLIDVFVYMSAFASYYVYPGMAKQFESNLLYIPLAITFSLAIVVTMMNFYIYLMMTATDLSIANLIKNSFALAFVGMKNNLISMLICGITAVGMIIMFLYATPLFMLITPFIPIAQVWFAVCFNSYPVIQKFVINPYYESIGQINPELVSDYDEDDEAVFQDMGGKEKPVEKRKKTKGRRIS